MKNLSKRRTKVVVTFVLFLIFLETFFSAGLTGSAEAASAALPSGYDVVFVMDTSYSMRESDKEGIATEVVKMFMDMSDASRTKVGFVAYNHQIVAASPLTSIAVAARRTGIQTAISSLKRSGYTDLGLGLRKGADLLASGTGDGRKSFLILLSDGETDFGPSAGSRTKADSDRDVASVIKSAKTRNYPVYTIGLNHNGAVNRKELEQIAGETGGSSYITSSADDLPEIVNRIFASQIRSQLMQTAGITATGSLQDVTVTIPDSSMEEANLVLLSEHRLKEAQLYYNSDNIRRYESNRYVILKIGHPAAGSLKLKLRGQAGDLIKVNLLGSYALEVDSKMTGGGASGKNAGNGASRLTGGETLKGQKTAFEARLVTGGRQPLQNEDVYTSLKAELVVTSANGQSKKQIPMVYKSGSFRAEYSFPQTGEYKWQVKMHGAAFYRNGIVNNIHAVNTGPEATGNWKLHAIREDGEIRLNLDDYFQDANKDKLTFSVANEKAFDLGHYRWDGHTLVLSSLRTGEAGLKLTAADPQGETASSVLLLTVESRYTVLKWSLGGAVLAIAAGVLLYFCFRPRPDFTGKLEGFFLATASGNEVPVKSWPLTSFPGRKVTLNELFRSLAVHEPLPEAERIVFTPGKNGTLTVKHDTRCAVQHGKTPVARNQKAVMSYNEKLYITFEDGITEIEIRYKAIKPVTNIYTGGDSNRAG
ncbi:VWA domain-containing protein [Paenibacillus durus]|uniref:VWFA domain-containing protein n=1 Tax=Paenibacillus durus TaxID=44251 RepID=A0A089HU15_PAEDU|nr:VWA domain-containing protein [Paenibacillus durus]AIQ14245.1 hypothetical protein PDUR_21810 [Paenibacillus durus]